MAAPITHIDKTEFLMVAMIIRLIEEFIDIFNFGNDISN